VISDGKLHRLRTFENDKLESVHEEMVVNNFSSSTPCLRPQQWIAGSLVLLSLEGY